MFLVSKFKLFFLHSQMRFSIEYLEEFIRQHPGGVGNALENDIVAQYLIYGTAKAVSLVSAKSLVAPVGRCRLVMY